MKLNWKLKVTLWKWLFYKYENYYETKGVVFFFLFWGMYLYSNLMVFYFYFSHTIHFYHAHFYFYFTKILIWFSDFIIWIEFLFILEWKNEFFTNSYFIILTLKKRGCVLCFFTIKSEQPLNTLIHGKNSLDYIREMIFVQPFCNNFLTTFSFILTLCFYSLSSFFFRYYFWLIEIKERKLSWKLSPMVVHILLLII